MGGSGEPRYWSWSGRGAWRQKTHQNNLDASVCLVKTQTCSDYEIIFFFVELPPVSGFEAFLMLMLKSYRSTGFV